MMIAVYVYEASTGRILRSGSCPKEMISNQAGEGEVVVEGEANDLTQCVDLTTLELIDKPLGFDPPETDYRVLRIHSYPPLADQIGAILKGGDALIEMQSIVQAVKAKYPKL
jgi:hypothetical protein